MGGTNNEPAPDASSLDSETWETSSAAQYVAVSSQEWEANQASTCYVVNLFSIPADTTGASFSFPSFRVIT